MNARNENIWLRSLITGVLVSSLATFTTGCDTMHDYTVTGHLWDVGGVNRCMPAPSPNLKLYRRSDNQDVLVTYDELREKNDKTRRRAFFFQTNVDRLVQGKKPRFVNPEKVNRLNLLPVAEITATNPPTLEIIGFKYSEANKEFTVVWSGQDLGPCSLPDYVDGRSQAQRVLLTPLAVTGDVVIYSVAIGSVFGICMLYGYAMGGYSTGL